MGDCHAFELNWKCPGRKARGLAAMAPPAVGSRALIHTDQRLPLIARSQLSFDSSLLFGSTAAVSRGPTMISRFLRAPLL
jgi:hypothetical protein